MENIFPTILKETRRKKKMTLTYLSQKTGIDQGYLSRLERGEKSNPSSEVLTRLADVLDVTTDYLLGRIDDPQEKGTDNKDNNLTPLDEDVFALARNIQHLDSESKDALLKLVESMRKRGREAKDD